MENREKRVVHCTRTWRWRRRRKMLKLKSHDSRNQDPTVEIQSLTSENAKKNGDFKDHIDENDENLMNISPFLLTRTRSVMLLWKEGSMKKNKQTLKNIRTSEISPSFDVFRTNCSSNARSHHQAILFLRFSSEKSREEAFFPLGFLQIPGICLGLGRFEGEVGFFLCFWRYLRQCRWKRLELLVLETLAAAFLLRHFRWNRMDFLETRLQGGIPFCLRALFFFLALIEKEGDGF